jgi:Cu2+-exporting ATPase
MDAPIALGIVLSFAGSAWSFLLGRPAAEQAGEEVDVDLIFAEDGVPCATFSFREALRHDARAEIEALQQAGAEIYLLSGDAELRVMRLARHLGLPQDHAFAALSPADKAALVTRLDRRDTLMIGDGINDAPALSAAYCAGTPAVDRPTLPARADFYFLGQGLGPISEALRVASQVRRVVRRNLVLALSYNTLVVTLSLLGMMSPVLCALLMPTSSLVIVFGTVRGMAAPARASVATRRRTSLLSAARPASAPRPWQVEVQP